MTNNEAMGELKGFLNYGDFYVLSAEAVDMAIKALETFPDNATNGDVIQALFPDAGFENAKPFSDERWETFKFKGLSHSDEVYKPTVLRVYRDWWNAPYNGGEKLCQEKKQ